jgi:UDP-N-acetylmuramate dehydrogenase
MAIKILENIKLSPFTTIGVGGYARYFIEVNTIKEALEAINFAKDKKLKIFILGNGSNIVVKDEGFDGVVIHNKIPGFFYKQISDKKIKLSLGSGEFWDRVVEKSVRLGFSGIENLSGVPGSVGGAVVQNISCYGQTLEEKVISVEAIDILSGKIKKFSKKECGFGYRDSVFRSKFYGMFFITKLELELNKDSDFKPVLIYPDVSNYFKNWEKPPTLSDVRNAILEIRARKGMLILDGSPSYRSVGSFFKNPIVREEKFEEIKKRAKNQGIDIDYPPIWYWYESNGMVKISAARLLEAAGFKKGFIFGNVGISPRHSLSIINLGDASAKEILDFSDKIRLEVFEKFGIELEPEAQII